MKHKEKTQQQYLDGQREEVDLLEGLDLAVLDQTSELGDWDPFLRKIEIRVLELISPSLSSHLQVRDQIKP